jgi:hypothetical protein
VHNEDIHNLYASLNTEVIKSMLGVSLVITAWCILRLWMEGSPPDMEGSFEYIE